MSPNELAYSKYVIDNIVLKHNFDIVITGESWNKHINVKTIGSLDLVFRWKDRKGNRTTYEILPFNTFLITNLLTQFL